MQPITPCLPHTYPYQENLMGVPRIPLSSEGKEAATTTAGECQRRPRTSIPDSWEWAPRLPVASAGTPRPAWTSALPSSKEVLLPSPLGWCQRRHRKSQGFHRCRVVTRPLYCSSGRPRGSRKSLSCPSARQEARWDPRRLPLSGIRRQCCPFFAGAVSEKTN